MSWRAAAVSEARSWVGTPYHHRARVKGAGTDCGMILIAVYSAVGAIEDFDPGEYSPEWMMHRSEEKYLRTVERYAVKVERDPLPGDIVLFKFGRCISHGAIVTEWPCVVHAFLQAGMVVEDDLRTNEDLNNRISGIWSVVER